MSHDDLPIGQTPVAIEVENTQAEQIGPGMVAIVAELSAVNVWPPVSEGRWVHDE